MRKKQQRIIKFAAAANKISDRLASESLANANPKNEEQPIVEPKKEVQPIESKEEVQPIQSKRRVLRVLDIYAPQTAIKTNRMLSHVEYNAMKASHFGIVNFSAFLNRG